MSPYGYILWFPRATSMCSFAQGHPATKYLPGRRTGRCSWWELDRKNCKLPKLKASPETKMFQGFENVFCCCTAEWKVGHTNIFSKTLVYLFPLPLPPQREKQPHFFSKPGGKAPAYCGFKSLLSHRAAAPSLSILQWRFLGHLTALAREAGSWVGSQVPAPGVWALPQGGQRSAVGLPQLGSRGCPALNVSLTPPDCLQKHRAVCEKRSL